MARRRLAFEDLLVVQLGLGAGRRQARAGAARACALDGDATLRAVRAALPFELTAAQAQAIDEIARDLAAPHPMQRLLVGDVGSGKTAVAFAAAAIVAAAGGQTLLMAPTEVLVEQHVRTLGALAARLGALPLRVARFTASMSRAERARDAGAVPLWRGRPARRHAGAAGVAARARRSAPGDRRRAAPLRRRPARAPASRRARRRSAAAPSGDIGHADPAHAGAHAVRRSRRQLPARAAAGPAAGRDRRSSPATSSEPRRRRAWKPPCVPGGRRTWSVRCARARNARARSPRWRARPSCAARCGPPASASGCCTASSTPTRKSRACARSPAATSTCWWRPRWSSSASTSPNATVMLVEEADRFGLAQLHQLRGRVGRGAHGGACLLCTSTVLPPESEAARRLAQLVATRDGFRIAEADLGAARARRAVRRAPGRHAALASRRRGRLRRAARAGARRAGAHRDRRPRPDARGARRAARGGARALGGGSGIRSRNRVESAAMDPDAPRPRRRAVRPRHRASRRLTRAAMDLAARRRGRRRPGRSRRRAHRRDPRCGRARRAEGGVADPARREPARCGGAPRRRGHPGRAADRGARAQPGSPAPGGCRSRPRW